MFCRALSTSFVICLCTLAFISYAVEISQSVAVILSLDNATIFGSEFAAVVSNAMSDCRVISTPGDVTAALVPCGAWTQLTKCVQLEGYAPSVGDLVITCATESGGETSRTLIRVVNHVPECRNQTYYFRPGVAVSFKLVAVDADAGDLIRYALETDTKTLKGELKYCKSSGGSCDTVNVDRAGASWTGTFIYSPPSYAKEGFKESFLFVGVDLSQESCMGNITLLCGTAAELTLTPMPVIRYIPIAVPRLFYVHLRSGATTGSTTKFSIILPTCAAVCRITERVAEDYLYAYSDLDRSSISEYVPSSQLPCDSTRQYLGPAAVDITSNLFNDSGFVAVKALRFCDSAVIFNVENGGRTVTQVQNFSSFTLTCLSLVVAPGESFELSKLVTVTPSNIGEIMFIVLTSKVSGMYVGTKLSTSIGTFSNATSDYVVLRGTHRASAMCFVRIASRSLFSTDFQNSSSTASVFIILLGLVMVFSIVYVFRHRLRGLCSATRSATVYSKPPQRSVSDDEGDEVQLTRRKKADGFQQANQPTPAIKGS